MTLLVLDHNLLSVRVWTDLQTLGLNNIITARQVFLFRITLTMVVHFHLLLLVDHCALACKDIDCLILCQDILDVRPFDLKPNKRWRRKLSIVILVILAITYLGLMLFVIRYKAPLIIECKPSFVWDVFPLA